MEWVGGEQKLGREWLDWAKEVGQIDATSMHHILPFLNPIFCMNQVRFVPGGTGPC